MRELETEYGDRVDFDLVPPPKTALLQEEIAVYGFTDLKHGLVVFDAAGEPVVMLPGHAFGREEIEAGIETALGS